MGFPYTYGAVDSDLIHGNALTITVPTLVNHSDGMATLSGATANANLGNYPVPLGITNSKGTFAEQDFVIIGSGKP